MMLIALVLAFVVPFCVMASLRRREEGATVRTFIADPLTMLVVGLVSALTCFSVRAKGLSRKQFLARMRVLKTLLWLFFLCFVAAESCAYFDLMRHPFDPLRTGNDFMWNGYVEWLFGPVTDAIPSYRSLGMNALALGLFLLQPFCLWLGLRLGTMLAYWNDLGNWSRPIVTRR